MPTYTVRVFTGNRLYAHTFNNVFIKLVGEGERESKRTWLSGAGGFFWGSESTYELECPESLGKLLLIELDKQTLPLFPLDNWFVEKVEVTSPEGHLYKFPIYHWIHDSEIHYYREGKAVFTFNEPNDSTRSAREVELSRRAAEYRWREYAEGWPHCITADTTDTLPPEVQFSFTKDKEFTLTAFGGLAAMKLTCLGDCQEPWTDFSSIHRVFCWRKDSVSDYVYKHWEDDWFFGYQYLNGLNPILIQRCTALPPNLPVTEEMVTLEGGASLDQEMKNGNLFLCDYKLLEGVKTNWINNEIQYLMAPLVLLHKTPSEQLKPVAIQLKQKPAEDNPIFLPSDPEYDWLLAKVFVRSADFNFHELSSHLLRTHLMAEVFAVSLLRNIPRAHPLYKLLVPHSRYTLHINVLARKNLISKDGVFTLYTASGREGMKTIVQRALSSLTYRSLCLPEDIQDRGVESVPHYYYRDDGLKLWDTIHRFVKGVLTYFYQSDADVQKDTELQNYIQDIFEHGFLSRSESGIPKAFCSVTEVVKFVTMVIFTCSAQHSAVNNGQLEYGNWMPNFPSTLQQPPPTEKGFANKHILLQTLPDINATVHALSALWLLSKQSSDFVALGHYPEELFSEDVPRELMQTFERELKSFDDAIDHRNKSLGLPYTALMPSSMENSVSI